MMPVQIDLKDGQSGYDVIKEYVYRYWRNNRQCDAAVSFLLSDDGIYWSRLVTEVASPDGSGCKFLRDWWEGEETILLLGIRDIAELDTIYGGIYE